LLKILFIYVFIYLCIYLFKREREYKPGREAEREGEADSLLSREPNAGLNPRILGS